MRLLGVELLRLRSRTSLVVLLLVGLASTLLFAWSAFAAAQPMSDAELAMAEQEWELAQQEWEETGPAQVEQCLADEAAEAERTGEDVDYMCDEWAPQRDWFFYEPPVFADFVSGSLTNAQLILCLVTLMLGVSFVAAEFSSGSIGTWLTFEPRRVPVLRSKISAVALVGLLFATVWAAAYLGANAVGYALAGSDVAMSAPLLHIVLRVGVLGMAIAVAGAGLAFLVRHTAAALGIALGYLIGVDLVLLGTAVPQGQRWMLVNNITAWATGRASYYVDECTVDATGTTCAYVERTISMTQGGLVVLAAVVLVTVLAVVTFRRRDL